MRTRSNQSGFALITVLVSASIGLLVVYFTLSALVHSLRANRHVELRGSLEAIRLLIRGGLDCETTLIGDPADVCKTERVLPLLTTNGRVLIGANGESGVRIGGWNVRAKCDTLGIYVHSARPIGSNSFESDPLTQRSYAWNFLMNEDPKYRLCASRKPATIVPAPEPATAKQLLNLVSAEVGSSATGRVESLYPAPCRDYIPNSSIGTCNPTPSSVTGTLQYEVPIGPAYYYDVRGTALELFLSARLSTEGADRNTKVFMRVSSGVTVLRDWTRIFQVSGITNGQGALVEVSNMEVISATPGQRLKFEFKLQAAENDGTGGLRSMGPKSKVYLPIKLILRDWDLAV